MAIQAFSNSMMMMIMMMMMENGVFDDLRYHGLVF